MKQINLTDLVLLSIDGAENMFVVIEVSENSLIVKNVQNIEPKEIKMSFAKNMVTE